MKKEKKNLKPNMIHRPRTDYVKNDGYPEHSGVQQAAPAYYGPFGDFNVIN